MKTIRFDVEESYGPNARPTVMVRLRTPEAEPSVPAIMDTGAWTSVFSMTVADLLGIDDVESGEPTPLTLADGKSAEGFAHWVEIRVLEKWMRVRLTFCPAFPSNTPNLLGMRDVFEQFVVAFEHETRMIYA